MARVRDWNLYRSFLAVAEAGSFSGAARRIGTAQPTIGRHVAALEEGLGAQLFQRSSRGLVLTQVGQDLVRHAQAMAGAVSAAERDASGGAEAETGAVRITAGEYISAEVLPAILAEVAGAYPQLQFEIVASNRTEDLLLGEADIAVRMVAPSQQALVARRLGVVRTGLYAHRSYVDRAGLPDSAEDFTTHRLIGFDRDFSVLRTSRPAPPLAREDFGFRTDNISVQVAAVRAGLGIGALHIAGARGEPELVPILPDQLVFERDVWLAMHEDLRRVRRVRLVFDALADGLLGYLARDPR